MTSHRQLTGKPGEPLQQPLSVVATSSVRLPPSQAFLASYRMREPDFMHLLAALHPLDCTCKLRGRLITSQRYEPRHPSGKPCILVVACTHGAIGKDLQEFLGKDLDNLYDELKARALVMGSAARRRVIDMRAAAQQIEDGANDLAKALLEE